jgi:hypothetical protein
MRKKLGLLVTALVLAFGLGACASDYGIQPGGPHFASWTHARYSVRGGEKPVLSKEELAQAKKESWWGIPVRYTVDELE